MGSRYRVIGSLRDGRWSWGETIGPSLGRGIREVYWVGFLGMLYFKVGSIGAGGSWASNCLWSEVVRKEVRWIVVMGQNHIMGGGQVTPVWEQSWRCKWSTINRLNSNQVEGSRGELKRQPLFMGDNCKLPKWTTLGSNVSILWAILKDTGRQNIINLLNTNIILNKYY